MKMYVAVRFKGLENKSEVEQLCAAVHAAGLVDICFVRDVENYQKTFDNPIELWQRAKAEIEACDALLIDVSDAPTGGRVVEAGIAFGLGLPVVVIVKEGTAYKDLYNGIAMKVITYDKYADITTPLNALFISK